MKYEEVYPKNAQLCGKWCVYLYSQYELDKAISDCKPIYSTYHTDYLLYVENIKTSLKNLGYTQLKNALYTSEYYNFEILNIDKTHPDRSVDNSFLFSELVAINTPHKINYSSLKKIDNIWYSPISLCTHTTSHIWRALHEKKLISPMFVIGSAFRRETEDATHSIEFDNLDLCITDMTYEKMIRTISDLFTQWGFKVDIRRTKYPYVSPAIEGYISKGDYELEVFGAGLFLKNILKKVDVHTNVLGAGIGLSRLYLLKMGKSKLTELSEL